MKTNRSYFDSEAMAAGTDRLRQDNHCPAWLIEALSCLSENADVFPAEEDDHRHVVEYIYPH